MEFNFEPVTINTPDGYDAKLHAIKEEHRAIDTRLRFYDLSKPNNGYHMSLKSVCDRMVGILMAEATTSGTPDEVTERAYQKMLLLFGQWKMNNMELQLQTIDGKKWITLTQIPFRLGETSVRSRDPGRTMGRLMWLDSDEMRKSPCVFYHIRIERPSSFLVSRSYTIRKQEPLDMRQYINDKLSYYPGETHLLLPSSMSLIVTHRRYHLPKATYKVQRPDIYEALTERDKTTNYVGAELVAMEKGDELYEHPKKRLAEKLSGQDAVSLEKKERDEHNEYLDVMGGRKTVSRERHEYLLDKYFQLP